MGSAAVGYTDIDPETGASATIGDITKIKVAFEVYNSSTCSGSPIRTLLASVTDGPTLGDGIGTATASLPDPGGTTDVTYCVVARIVGASDADPNPYYTAHNAETAAVTFYLNSGRFASGGGWIVDPNGSKGNFGFNARYTKRGAPKGQMVPIYRGLYRGELADFVIKSNAITQLVFGGTEYPISATLQGKASLTVVRASDGVVLEGGPGSDDDGGVQLVGSGPPRDQPIAYEGLHGLRRLALARLDQQVAARRQPQGRRGDHPPLNVEPVHATVERHARLVHAGLRRQQLDLVGRHVGCVGDQDVDAAMQRSGQRVIEITLVHPPPGAGHVAAGAPHGGGIDVDGVQLDPVQRSDQRDAHRARAAAQVHDDGTWPGEGGSLANEELGSAARYEDAGPHGDPQATELRPAEDVFEGKTGDPAVDQGGEVGRRPRLGDEQPRLVLGVDTAGGPKPGDDLGPTARGWGSRHGSGLHLNDGGELRSLSSAP